MPYSPRTWVEGEKGTAADLNHIELGISAAAWASFNVKEVAYGAKGNGVANDTAAFTAAIKAAKEAGGGTILIPAGNYLVEECVISYAGETGSLEGVYLEGVGRGATVLTKINAGASPVLTVKTTTAGHFIADTAIRHLTIYGKAKEGPGVLLERVAWGTVKDVECVTTSAGLEGKGVISYGLDDLIIFTGNTRGIVLTRSTVTSTLGCNSVSIRRSVISSCAKAGIEADYCPQLVIENSDLEQNGEAGVLTTGAILIGANVTSEFGAGQVIIRNCWLEENKGRAIQVKSGELRVHDSLVFQTDSATTTTKGRDIYIDGTTTRVVIDNCEFPSNISSTPQVSYNAATESKNCTGAFRDNANSKIQELPPAMVWQEDGYFIGEKAFGGKTAGGGAEWFLSTFTGGPTVRLGSLQVWEAGKGFNVKEGANSRQGTATLAAGKVVVANTSVTANSRIFLTAQDNNSTGALRVSARVAAKEFTIESNVGTDKGVVAYEIFEPAE